MSAYDPAVYSNVVVLHYVRANSDHFCYAALESFKDGKNMECMKIVPSGTILHVPHAGSDVLHDRALFLAQVRLKSKKIQPLPLHCLFKRIPGFFTIFSRQVDGH